MQKNAARSALVLLVLLKMAVAGTSVMSGMDGGEPEGGKCEEITIPMCMGIGYNYTSMPNEMNHDSQDEAGLEVHQFWPLVEIKCSPDLKFFLCSMYAPICLPGYKKPLPTCRGLCQQARDGCEPIMNQYGFPWPERMDCDRFPKNGESSDNLCMDRPTAGTTSTAKPPPPAKAKPCKGSKNCTSAPGGARKPGCKCSCQRPLVPLGVKEQHQHPGANRSVAGLANCAYPCKETFFNQEEKEFATVWITLWSSLCAASTLMTLTTFFIETERFMYPERPIVFLSACYFLVSIGYLIRVGVGHEEVACEAAMIRYSSTGANLCSSVFLLIYFFGMASSIWWVILAFTWFLAAGLKWGNEAIAGYSQYYHLAAWLVPTVQTVAVLLSGAVDGDPISGVCYVGNMNMENLQVFVLAPLFIYLFVGTSFLVAGFVSLFHIRAAIRKQGGAGAGSKADKLEKLMIRIGIFSVLYTVPASIVIACHLYENAYHEEWLRAAACSCADAKPIYSVMMLKYFMALAVGITSGVWIWSGKTLDSWRRLWRRLFGRREDRSGANAALIKSRGKGAQYAVAGAGAASLLGPAAGSVTSAPGAHHLMHHHVLKQPPLSHV